MTYEIDISCSDPHCAANLQKLTAALEHGLKMEGVEGAVLSVTIVDNPTMHRLNREHLQHDFPTDVISFQLDWACDGHTLDERRHLPSGRSQNATIEGEIVVGSEYATQMAARCGWSPEDELTLYVIHGMLHICGYDDLTNVEKNFMRARERAVLDGLGLVPEYPDDAPYEDEPPGSTIAPRHPASNAPLEDPR